MKNRISALLMALVAAGGIFVNVVNAQDSSEATASAKYAGVDNCKMCHPEIHEAWGKSAHARSFELLVNVGKEKDPACLPCHTTGFGQGGFVDAASTPGLKGATCESCHGPGADHMGDAEKILRVPSGKTCASCHQKNNIHTLTSDSEE